MPDYEASLSELARAIEIYDQRKQTGDVPDFDPREGALDETVGAEFSAFRLGEAKAAAARFKGQSLLQLTAKQ